MNWYSLRVISGKEEKIKESIFRELSLDNSISTDIEDILVPMENVVEIKNGKKTNQEKSLLSWIYYDEDEYESAIQILH